MVKRSPKSSKEVKPQKEEKPQKAKLPEPTIAFSELYRYSTKFDYFLMIVGSICSAATGAIMPCSVLLLGNVANQINPADMAGFVEIAKDYCGYYFALAGGGFVVAFIGMASWMLVGERQTLNLRKNYFRAMLKQEIGYFDTVNPNEFATKSANDSQMILMGIGEKVFTFISSIALVVAGYIVGFVKGWKLSCVMLGALPVMFLGCFLFIFAMQKTNKVQIESYEKSGGIAEQALAAIKTVTALGGEEKEVKAYKKALDESRFKVIIYGFLSGICIGLMLFGFFFSYFLGLWYGAKLIHEQEWNSALDRPYSFGDVLTIFLAMMIGSSGFTGATTPLKSFVNAKRAGARVIAIIDRPSKINVEDPSGEKPNFRGKIEFKNVQFAYPTKPDKQILKGINLTANIGQKIAFVGESGCGKTTAMQLIERFYDTDAGEVLLDGIPIKSINLRWLRQNIGYVGQEPALFACSIRDNMKFAKKDASDDEIWNALKAVNMDVFIKGLSKQLDTNVGAGGGQISGGQKQRLAIARAVLKNPSILLLDEATSALDRKNEVEIQATLDHVSKERTTIVIAHRLSTIQNADLILVFDKGVIAERGTHQELLNNKGLYYNLTKHQISQLEANDKKKQQENQIVFPNPDQIKHRIDQPTQSEINKSKSQAVQIKSRNEHSTNFLTADERNNLKAFRHQGDEELDNLEKEEENTVNRQRSILEDIPVQLEVLSNQHNVLNLGGAIISASYTQVNEAHDIKHNEPDSATKSDTKSDAKSDTKPKKKQYSMLEIVSRLTDYGKGARFALYLTYLIPMLNGSAMTCSGILLAEMMEILSNPSASDLISRSNFVTMWFLIMGAIVIVILFIERGVQSVIAERITTAVRVDVFQKLLRMHMGFFDDPMNSAGALSGRLASDATQVNALLTNAGNLCMVGIGALVTGIIMAFVGDWRVALVGLGLIPFLLMGGKFNAQVSKRLSAAQDDAYVEANGYLAEILNNMRTIASFSEEEEFRRIYDVKLAEPAKEFKERSVLSGAAYGYFYFIMTASYGILFVVGAYMMRDHGLGIKGLFLVIMGITNGTRHAGNAMDAIPEAGNAVTGAEGLFRLIDAQSEIDINDEAGKITKPIEGNFEFANVSFKYPTRDQYVLRDFNLKINAGNKIAFVGSSGCGKSTVVQLIMRFYNPVSGAILLDGIPIQNYNLKHLRRYLSIVSQEPVLFNGTIEENIKYSCENATDDEIREAAKQANALRFIENNEFDDLVPGKNQNFGTGFQRKVGPKGSQMSGGQKQRIAIARAIIKKPRILLLDEATSALDSQSEAVVQESLDKIMQGKTSIAIAHRISTIRDANEILLFDRGIVAERGTYEALIKAQGMFYRLEKGI